MPSAAGIHITTRNRTFLVYRRPRSVSRPGRIEGREGSIRGSKMPVTRSAAVLVPSSDCVVLVDCARERGGRPRGVKECECVPGDSRGAQQTADCDSHGDRLDEHASLPFWLSQI